MSETTFLIIVSAAFAVAFIVAFIYSIIKKKQREASYPKEWVSIGTPPPYLDIALRVIKEEMGDWPWRWGGTIEWVDGPFSLNGVAAAGAMYNPEEPRLKVMKHVNIYQTALAHEIRHVWWVRKNLGGDGENREEFYKWILATNMKIKQEIDKVNALSEVLPMEL